MGLMSKIIILAIVLVAITTMSCIADQLAWNSRGTCEEAVKSIRQGSILLSYCSLCSNEHVEVWLVRGIIIAPTAAQGLFEVNILGIRLYRSSEAFQESCQGSGRFPRSVVGYISPPFFSDTVFPSTSFSPVIDPPMSSLLWRWR